MSFKMLTKLGHRWGVRRAKRRTAPPALRQGPAQQDGPAAPARQLRQQHEHGQRDAQRGIVGDSCATGTALFFFINSGSS